MWGIKRITLLVCLYLATDGALASTLPTTKSAGGNVAMSTAAPSDTTAKAMDSTSQAKATTASASNNQMVDSAKNMFGTTSASTFDQTASSNNSLNASGAEGQWNDSMNGMGEFNASGDSNNFAGNESFPDAAESDIIDFVGEFEDVLTDLTDPMLRYRSEASGNKTLHLVSSDNMTVYLKLCVQAANTSAPVEVQLVDIVYSNDGDNDTITWQWEGKTIGEAITEPRTNWGQAWNIFRSTGPIGPVLSLPDGMHNFTLLLNTDVHGLELDNADFRTRNQDPTVNLLCEALLKHRE